MTPQALATDDATDEAPFASVGEVQDRHADLVEKLDATQAEEPDQSIDDVEQTLLEIRRFQKRVAATGAVIDGLQDRALVQSILDFWAIRETYILRQLSKLRAATAEFRGDGKGRVPAPYPEPHQLAAFDEESAPELPNELRPFVGLSAFTESDAQRGIFLGRDDAIEALVKALNDDKDNCVVVVSGPSGSGKSSLVMAGLLPALRNGAIQGSEGWNFWGPILPGPDPIIALLLAMQPENLNPVRQKEWMGTHKALVEANPRIIPDIIAESGQASTPSFLVIDQAEELISMTEDDTLRRTFAEAVLAFATVPEARNRVVIIVREDIVDRLLASPGLSDVGRTTHVRYRPKPLTSAELRTVIVGPAQKVGLKFDPGIVEELVREVVDDPAALPLLQFTLEQLWSKRRRNKITQQVFENVGAPNKALGRIAEEVYIKLGAHDNQTYARNIFMKLMTPSLGNEYIRKRVSRVALHQMGDFVKVDFVLERFVREGLICKTAGIAREDDRFEVTHEALLRNWPRLGEWLNGARKDDEKRLQFRAAANLWDNSGRKKDHLAIGTALEEANIFAATDPLIKEYVDASIVFNKQKNSRRNSSRVVAFFIVISALGALIYYLKDANNDLIEEKIISDRTTTYLTNNYCYQYNISKNPEISRMPVGSRMKLIDSCVKDIRSQAKSIATTFLVKPESSTVQLKGLGSSKPSDVK